MFVVGNSYCESPKVCRGGCGGVGTSFLCYVVGFALGSCWEYLVLYSTSIMGDWLEKSGLKSTSLKKVEIVLLFQEVFCYTI